MAFAIHLFKAFARVEDTCVCADRLLTILLFWNTLEITVYAFVFPAHVKEVLTMPHTDSLARSHEGIVAFP